MSPTHYQQEALSDYLSEAEQGSVWFYHPSVGRITRDVIITFFCAGFAMDQQ